MRTLVSWLAIVCFSSLGGAERMDGLTPSNGLLRDPLSQHVVCPPFEYLVVVVGFLDDGTTVLYLIHETNAKEKRAGHLGRIGPIPITARDFKWFPLEFFLLLSSFPSCRHLSIYCTLVRPSWDDVQAVYTLAFCLCFRRCREENCLSLIAHVDRFLHDFRRFISGLQT